MKQSLPRGSKSRKGEGTEPSRNRNDSDAQPLCCWAASCPLAALTFLLFQCRYGRCCLTERQKMKLHESEAKRAQSQQFWHGFAVTCVDSCGLLAVSGFLLFLSPLPNRVGKGAFCRVWWPRAHFPLFPHRAAPPTPPQPGAAQQSPETTPTLLSPLRPCAGPVTLP